MTFDRPDARSLLAGERVTYAHYPTNRNVVNFIRNLFVAFRLLRRLRPHAIVTTGAGVAVPFCYVGRLYGARIVFVETFARISKLSLTARLVRPVAHRFFVQWPQLSERDRKAEYHGAVF